MPLIKCDYCQKEFFKKTSQFTRAEKHFCCKEHFFLYRKENHYPPPTRGTKCHTRLKMIAEMKK